MGVVVLLSGLGACAQVEREPLPEKAVVEEVESRERLDRQAWEQALELRGPLSWRPIGESVGDPAREGYWCGRAMVLSAEVRQAVRAWRAAVAATGVAGSPGPIEVTGRGREGERSDVAGELRITVDLLGLLGLSPLAEEREMSEQRARHERSRLEAAAWRAACDAREAFLELGAARAREDVLARMVEEGRPGSRRVRLLVERGRIGADVGGKAAAAVARLERLLERQRAEIAASRERLARVSGMGPESAAFESVPALEGTDLEDLEADIVEPDARQLLDGRPDLRAATLEYARSEVLVRLEAARQWPRVNLGPTANFASDDVLLGGILDVDATWPGVVARRVAIAVERREAAREAVEDRLLRARQQVHAAVERSRAARRAWRAASVQEMESRAPWRASQARLAVREGHGPTEKWLEAMRGRMDALMAVIDAAEDLRMARLDWRRAVGPPPVEPVMEGSR